MTRKHFVAVASAIRAELIETQRTNSPEDIRAANTLNSLANRLSDEFSRMNPNFSRSTFIRACGFAVG